MGDAPVAVAAFARQVQFAGFLREGHAQFLQPGNGGGRVFHGELRGFQVAQAGAGDQGVLHVRRDAVALAEHCGDAALCPVARAVAERALGDHGHAVALRQVQRGGEPGQAAADDEDVETLQVCHVEGRGEPPPGRSQGGSDPVGGSDPRSGGA